MPRIILALILFRALLIALGAFNGQIGYGGDASTGPPWMDADGYRYRVIEDRFFDPHGRWDANGYLLIAYTGYHSPDSEGVSNAAFFPGYPWLINTLFGVVEPFASTEGESRKLMFHAAHVLSALAFLGVLVLFHRWVTDVFGPGAALRASLLLVFFPASFVFGCILSESTFLFMTLLAFHAASRRFWMLAAAAATYAAMTRAVGSFLVVPLGLMYLEQCSWRFGRLGWRWLWLLMIPLGVFCVLLHMAEQTGDFFAYTEQQRNRFGHTGFPTISGITDLFAWAGKDGVARWRDVLQVLAMVFGITGITLTWRAFRDRPYRVAFTSYVAVFVLVAALSGALISMVRYVVILFPLFAVWGDRLSSPRQFLPVVTAGGLLACVLWFFWIHNWEIVI